MPTVTELKNKCKRLGIRGYSHLKKQDLINLLNKSSSRKKSKRKKKSKRLQYQIEDNVKACHRLGDMKPEYSPLGNILSFLPYSELRKYKSVSRGVGGIARRRIKKLIENKGGQQELNKQLLRATRGKNVALVAELLAHGANPNAQTNSGNTALFWASGYKTNIDIVTLLLATGADPNIQTNSDGSTALMGASLYNNEEIIKLLLAAGADPNMQNNILQTALMFASQEGNIGIVTLLLKNGADPKIQDAEDNTALSIAKLEKRYHLAYNHSKQKQTYDKIIRIIKKYF